MHIPKPNRQNRLKTNRIIKDNEYYYKTVYNRTAKLKSYDKNRFKPTIYWINGSNTKSYYKTRKSQNSYNNVQKYYKILSIIENKHKFNYTIFFKPKQILHRK